MAGLPSTIPSLQNRCAPSIAAQFGCQTPNFAMQCLWKEAMLWHKISADPAFALLQLAPRYRAMNIDPFLAMPKDATRLNQIGFIPISSLVANTYSLVTSYLVPPGCDGVVNNTMNKFVPQTGPDFQDGSGQLTWVIGINNYLAYNYNNIGVEMGDNAQLGPTAHDGGIRIKSNDLIAFYVTATAPGLAFLDPNGVIVCALQGWTYPNR